MPTVGAQLLFRVDPGPLPDDVATLLFDVRPDTAAHPHLLFDVTQTVGAFAQLWPFRHTDVTQTTWPVVTMSIRGTAFALFPSDLVGDLSITLDPAGTSWELTLRQQGEGSERATWARPLTDWEIDWGTVAPGISPIAFDLRYRTALLEEISYPIMVNGVTRANSTDVNASTIAISGIGAEGRYDKAKTTLFRPAGHGLTVGELADLLFAAADPPIPSSFGKVGGPLTNVVAISCERAWAVADEMFDQWNFQLAVDENGLPAIFPKAPVSGTPRFTLNEGDLTTLGTLDFDIGADVPTCITVEGGKVVSDAEDGAVESIEVQLIFGIFAVGQALFQQTAIPQNFAPTGFSTSPPVKFQLKRRITTYITTVAGCETRREIIEEEWTPQPEVARYQIQSSDVDLVFLLLDGFIFAEGATSGDENPAFIFPQEHFGLVRNTVIATTRDEIGRELLVTKTVGGWFAPRTAIKLRTTAGQEWATRPHLASTLLFSTKEGQKLSSNAHNGANYYRGASTFERLKSHGLPGNAGLGGGKFSVAGAITTEVEGIDFIPAIGNQIETAGYKTRDFKNVTRFDRFPGNLFLFGDGVESRDQEEQEHDLEPIEETTYSAQGLLSHSSTRTRYKLDGGIDGEQIVDLGLGGFLPAVPTCDATTNEETAPLRVTICLNQEAEQRFIVNKADPIRVDWLEDIASIEAYILRRWREELAIVVTCQIPANASLRPLMEGRFTFERRGYDNRICWIETVTHPRTPAAPGQPAGLLTGLVLKVPTVDS